MADAAMADSPSESLKWKKENGYAEIAEIEGRWGSMFLDYEDWEVASYGCKMCDFCSRVEASTHIHISEEHGTREKMEKLADILEINDDSRIDRFHKVMKTMGDLDWARELTDARKRSASEVPDDTIV